jgi:hypothetical protein
MLPMAEVTTLGAVFVHRPGTGTEYGLVNAKKLIVLVAVAFVLFFLITQPTESANVVDTVLTWLKDGAESIITFVRSLFT